MLTVAPYDITVFHTGESKLFQSNELLYSSDRNVDQRNIKKSEINHIVFSKIDSPSGKERHIYINSSTNAQIGRD